MEKNTIPAIINLQGLSDEQIVARVLQGETVLFELIVRRYNQRLYRTTRTILGNDALAEQALQDAYLRAYRHLPQFAGRATFAGWLLRIAVNEGLMLLRGRRPDEPSARNTEDGDPMDYFASSLPSPEQQTSKAELRKFLEDAIEALSEPHRIVFVLREVEEMSTPETAEALGISESNVKIRLHRARAILRRKLYSQVSAKTKEVFPFNPSGCDRVIGHVINEVEKRCSDGQRGGMTVH
jgi:RNA polymerase sigma-70 factor (ECF subfamily)